MNQRLLRIAIIALTAIALTVLSYMGLKKFLGDRERVMNYRAPLRSQQRVSETRKTTLPALPLQPNTGADAAVQRNLRTIEEINRVNEMNRRLMEQEERNRRR